LIVFFATPLR